MNNKRQLKGRLRKMKATKNRIYLVITSMYYYNEEREFVVAGMTTKVSKLIDKLNLIKNSESNYIYIETWENEEKISTYFYDRETVSSNIKRIQGVKVSAVEKVLDKYRESLILKSN